MVGSKRISHHHQTTFIYVNGTLTTEQTDPYAYKAYLETILNYGTEDEETILGPQGYYSALNYPPSDLMANEIDNTHNDHAALSKERKTAVDGLVEMKEIVWVTTCRFVEYR